MNLDWEVIATSTIKRKKSWSNVAWVGEKEESILVTGKGRCSILYPVTGNTKKKIPSLHNYTEDTKDFAASKNGHFFTGVTKHGLVFLWDKDKNSVQQLQTPVPSFSAQDTGNRILVICNYSRIYVWRRDLSKVSPRKQKLPGEWFSIQVDDRVSLPSLANKEANLSIGFFHNQVIGSGAMCTYTFNQQEQSKLCITTLVLRWDSITMTTADSPPYYADWNELMIDLPELVPGTVPLPFRGSYVTALSASSQLLAVAVNQKYAARSSLLFIGPVQEAVVACGLKRLLGKHGLGGKACWVADLQWTAGDLFLALITRSGGFALLTQFGVPVLVTTNGNSVEFGPSYLIPLIPAMSLRKKNQTSDVSVISESGSISEVNPSKQIFSVAPHPRLSLLLLCDGFQVFVLQLMEDLDVRGIGASLIGSAVKDMEVPLQQICHSNAASESPANRKVDAALLSLSDSPYKSTSKPAIKSTQAYNFEEVGQDVLNDTMESFMGTLGDITAKMFRSRDNLKGSLDAGVISFGQVLDQNMEQEETSNDLNAITILSRAQRLLTSVWGMVCTTDSHQWTAELEHMASFASETLVKLMVLMLCVDATVTTESTTNRPMNMALSCFGTTLSLLKFDRTNQNMLACAVKFIHKATQCFLDYTPAESDLHQDLSKCYSVLSMLKLGETTIDRVYSQYPVNSALPFLSSKSCLRKSSTSPLTEIGNTMNLVAKHKKHRDGSPLKIEMDEESQSFKATDLFQSFSEGGSASSHRLIACWRKLCKFLKTVYKNSLVSSQGGEELSGAFQRLFTTVIMKLQQSDRLSSSQSSFKNKGDELYLEGHGELAIGHWIELWNSLSEPHRHTALASYPLHAILYSHLQQLHLVDALEFAHDLLLQSLSEETSQGSGRCTWFINSEPVLQVIMSLARFMAAYFTNSKLFTLPPYLPLPLPQIDQSIPDDLCPLTLAHSDVSQAVTNQDLSCVWNVGSTLDLLLVTGLHTEAVWFTLHMGDWRTAYALSASCQLLSSRVALRSTMLLELQPERILASVLSKLFDTNMAPGYSKDSMSTLSLTQFFESFPEDGMTDRAKIISSVQSLLLPAALLSQSVVLPLLEGLVTKLKTCVTELSPLVPDEFYLPAPATFCPQPPNPQEENLSDEVRSETQTRQEISRIVSMMLVVLQAASIAGPCCSWLVRNLRKIQTYRKKMKIKGEGTLPESLLKFGSKKHKSVPTETWSLFRDFYSMMWMLDTRDKLSLTVRQAAQIMDNRPSGQKHRKSSKYLTQWSKHCSEALSLCVHYLPFTDVMQCEGEMLEILLSYISELPPSCQAAEILADHIYDTEMQTPEVQERLDTLLKTWQRADPVTRKTDVDLTGLDKETGIGGHGSDKVPLTVYYFDQCQRTERLNRKRQLAIKFETTVFSDTKAHGVVGSRAFEYEQDFYKFLDVFLPIVANGETTHDREGSKNGRSAVLLPTSQEVLWYRELQGMTILSSHDTFEELASIKRASCSGSKLLSTSTTPSKDSHYKPRHGFFRSRRSRSLENIEKNKSSNKEKLKRTSSVGGETGRMAKQISPSLENPCWKLLLKQQLPSGDETVAKLRKKCHWLVEWTCKPFNFNASTLNQGNSHLAVRVPVSPDAVMMSFHLSQSKGNRTFSQIVESSVDNSFQETSSVKESVEGSSLTSSATMRNSCESLSGEIGTNESLTNEETYGEIGKGIDATTGESDSVTPTNDVNDGVASIPVAQAPILVATLSTEGPVHRKSISVPVVTLSVDDGDNQGMTEVDRSYASEFPSITDDIQTTELSATHKPPLSTKQAQVADRLIAKEMRNSKVVEEVDGPGASRMSMVSDPIYNRITLAEFDMKENDVASRRSPASDRTISDEFLMSDSATTVWSSSTLPGFSSTSIDFTGGTLTEGSRKKERKHRVRRKASHADDELQSTGDPATLQTGSNTMGSATWKSDSTWQPSQRSRRKHQRQRPTVPNAQFHTYATPEELYQPQTTDVVQDIGFHLQNIVREEMKRIVQLQQQSLATMIGALEPADIAPNLPSRQPEFGMYDYRSKAAGNVRGAKSYGGPEFTPGRQQPNHQAFYNSEPVRSHPMEAKNVSSDPTNMASPRVSNSRRGSDLRMSLRELQNLKHSVSDKDSTKVPFGHRQPECIKLPLLRLNFSRGDNVESVPGRKPQPSFFHPAKSESHLWSQEDVRNAPRQFGGFSNNAWTGGLPLLRLPKPSVPANCDVPHLAMISNQKAMEDRERSKDQVKQAFIRKMAAEQQARGEEKQQVFGQNLLKVNFTDLKQQRVAEPVRYAEVAAERELPVKLTRSAPPEHSPDSSPKKRQRRQKKEKAKATAPVVSSQVIQVKEAVNESSDEPQLKVHSEATATRPNALESVEEPKQDAAKADTAAADKITGQGYALTPGMFDEYLKLMDTEEGAAETYASIQYRAATASYAKRPKTCDAETMTEAPQVPSLAQPSSPGPQVPHPTVFGSPTTQQGAPPAEEAMTPGHRGHVPPQEIFMEFRYGDSRQVQHEGTAAVDAKVPDQRKFISVVDISTSAMEQLPVVTDSFSKQPPRQPREAFTEQGRAPAGILKDTNIANNRMRGVEKGSFLKSKLTGKPEQKEQPESFANIQYKLTMAAIGKEPETEEELVRRGDRLTHELLHAGRAVEDLLMPPARALQVPSARQAQPRAKVSRAVNQRLITMDQQLAAIEEMSSAIEGEYSQANKMLQTVSKLSDYERRASNEYELQASLEFEEALENVLDGRSMSPTSFKFTSTARDADERNAWSEGEVDTESKMNQVLVSRSRSFEGMDLTASGQSDQEFELKHLLPVKEISTTEPKFTKKFQTEPMRISLDRLSDMAYGDETNRRTPKILHAKKPSSPVEKARLRNWMKKRRADVIQKYHQEQDLTRTQERQPFQPSNTTNKMGQSLITKEDVQREERRRNMEYEFYDKRVDEAQMLLGSMLTDKPSLPKEQPKHKVKRKVSRKLSLKLSGPAKRSALTSTAPAMSTRMQNMLDTVRQDYVYNQSEPEEPRPKKPMTRAQYIKSQQRLYGTKRVPGLYQRYEKTSPRQTKTYQEQLQELKPPPSPTPKSPHSRTMQEVTRRGLTTRGPRHAPMTYFEQVQQINKAAGRTVKSQQVYRPGSTARGAGHSSKQGSRAPPRQSLKVRPRQRPYAGPYPDLREDSMDWEVADSILSSWSVSDNVRDLIGADEPYATASQITLNDLSDVELDFNELVGPTLSQLNIDRWSTGDPRYTRDHRTVSMTPSMQSEMSINSDVIDWDAVDKLLENVSRDTSERGSTVGTYY